MGLHRKIEIDMSFIIIIIIVITDLLNVVNFKKNFYIKDPNKNQLLKAPVENSQLEVKIKSSKFSKLYS